MAAPRRVFITAEEREADNSALFWAYEDGRLTQTFFRWSEGSRPDKLPQVGDVDVRAFEYRRGAGRDCAVFRPEKVVSVKEVAYYDVLERTVQLETYSLSFLFDTGFKHPSPFLAHLRALKVGDLFSVAPPRQSKL